MTARAAEDPSPSGRLRIWAALLLAAGLVVLASAPFPQFDGDAPLYGKIAKNVLDSGDWLTFSHHPGWLVDKPPLTIWLIAVSLGTFGDGDGALRFWQLLLVLGLAAVTYRLARLGIGREASLLAALILLTIVQVFYQGMIPQQDVALAFFLALGFYDYLAYRAGGRAGAAARTGLWIALAVLSKGIVALAATGLVVVADLLLAGRGTHARGSERQFWRWRDTALGAVVFLLVAAPWFVIGALRQGGEFVDTFFLWGNLGIGRFFRPVLAPELPVWQSLPAYVPLLALGMLPWTGLLPGAIAQGWRSLRAGPASLRLCALWAGLYFLLLSVAPGDKVGRYLLPCYPPLAILSARYLSGAFDEPRGLRVASVISLLVGVPGALGAGWLAAGRFPQEWEIYVPLLLPFFAAFSLVLAAFAVLGLAGRGRLAVAVLAAGAVMSYGIFEWTAAPQWRGLWPWQRVAGTVHALYRPGDQVLIYGYGTGNNFAFYYLLPPVRVVDDDAVLAQAWERGPVFGLLPPDVLARVQDRFHPTVLVEMPAGLVLVTNRRPTGTR